MLVNCNNKYMNAVKQFLRHSALLAAIITIFAYALYMVNEMGFLNAFGLFDFDTLGLIPLQIQIVIISVFFTVLVTVVFLLLALLVTFYSRRLAYKKSKATQNIVNILSVCVSSLLLFSPILILTYLTSRLLFVVQIATISVTFLLFYLMVPLIQMKRTEKDYQSTLISFRKPLQNIARKYKIGFTVQQVALTGILLIMLLPLFSYSLGFINARTKKSYFITEIQNNNYIIIRQYGNQVILAKLNDQKLTSIYRVEYLDGSNSLEFRAIKVLKLDFSAVEKSSL